MKKVLLLLLIAIFPLFLTTSCVTIGFNNDSMVNGKLDDMIKYEIGIFDNKNWDDSTGTYYGDVVPNKMVAVNIAVSVFNGMEKSETAGRFTPQLVFYDEEMSIWIVTFWDSDSYNNGIVGYDCSIAINKKDGKIKRIWFGE